MKISVALDEAFTIFTFSDNPDNCHRIAERRILGYLNESGLESDIESRCLVDSDDEFVQGVAAGKVGSPRPEYESVVCIQLRGDERSCSTASAVDL